MSDMHTGERIDAKQWEIRAALRAYSRANEDDNRHPAELILNAALDLVREQEDFTVKQLSERAGVALQTFYRHFGTKDELILAVMEENIARGARNMLTELESITDPVQRLHWLVTVPIRQEYGPDGQRMLQWAARERQRLRARYPKAVFDVHLPYRNAVLSAIEAVIDAGLATSNDPTMDATILQHEVMTIAHLAHGGGLEAEPAVVAERVWRMFWWGLCNRGGAEGE